MAILVAAKSSLIHSASDLVWEAIYDPRHWTYWDQDISRVELLETPKAGALGRIFFKSSKSERRLRILGVESRRSLSWEVEGTFGVWIQQCVIIHDAEGTILTFEVWYQGKWKTGVRWFTQARISAALDGWISRLASIQSGPIPGASSARGLENQSGPSATASDSLDLKGGTERSMESSAIDWLSSSFPLFE